MMFCVNAISVVLLSTIVLYRHSVVGPVETDPEYQLIVDSNNIVVEIDNEISKHCIVV